MKPFEKIKNLRKLAQYTQTQVAEVIGCDRSNYSHKERGTVQFNINEVLLILATLKKNVEKHDFSCWLADFLGIEDIAFEREASQKNFSDFERKQSKPISIDPAVGFLNECIREAGGEDYLNDKQKHALLEIIRDELKAAEKKAKKDIKKYLTVLKS